ncbi:MAG: PAS domain-containing protein [Acidobacteria bacterium]|nr:PAS domain-containing protein [Acidobacteriota bacterium]
MSPQVVYAFAGLTVLIAVIVGILTFALMRFAGAARSAQRELRDNTRENMFVAVALEQAVSKLRDQERATHARAEASERLNSEIVSSVTAGLLVVGLRGEVRILNPAGRRLLNLTEDGPPGSLGEFPDAARPLTALLDQCLTTGEPLVRRAVQIHGGPARAGLQASQTRDAHFGVTVSPLRDVTNAVQGAVCLFTDITSVIELEEQLRLKESLARLGELLAGLAHELRNGLATIHGYAKLLRKENLSESAIAYVRELQDETEAMTQTVTNFLNFAKPTALTLAPVDLRRVAERSAEELQPDAQRGGGQIIVCGEFPVIEGDELLLRQAFGNLLRNALEACADRQIAPQVAIEGSVDDALGQSRVVVCDNGPGIAAADRERIFQPFFTSKRNGTGLGLALVQKIIVTHNGRILVGEGPGGGACFTLLWALGSRL